jgi:hypothetical protein
MELSTISEATRCAATRIIFQSFMEPDGSLPFSEELSNCTYPEPDQSSQYHPNLSLNNPS